MAMEVKKPPREGRGSGPGARKARADSLGPRKDVIIRMPEDEARQLKVVAALEQTTVQEFCLRVLRPEIRKALQKHRSEDGLITR